MRRVLLSIVSTLVLSGCGFSFARQPTFLEDAIQRVDEGLAGVSYLNESDLLGDESGRRFVAARQFVREKQCGSMTADPLILVSLPVEVNFRATAEKDGGLRFLHVDSTAGNSVVVPMRLLTVTNIPNEYLKAMAVVLDAKNLPDDLVRNIKTDVSSNYNKLAKRTRMIVDTFESRDCAWPGPYERRRAETIFVPPTF